MLTQPMYLEEKGQHNIEIMIIVGFLIRLPPAFPYKSELFEKDKITLKWPTGYCIINEEMPTCQSHSPDLTPPGEECGQMPIPKGAPIMLYIIRTGVIGMQNH